MIVKIKNYSKDNNVEIFISSVEEIKVYKEEDKVITISEDSNHQLILYKDGLMECKLNSVKYQMIPGDVFKEMFNKGHTNIAITGILLDEKHWITIFNHLSRLFIMNDQGETVEKIV